MSLDERGPGRGKNFPADPGKRQILLHLPQFSGIISPEVW
jgi:hypothetical protein